MKSIRLNKSFYILPLSICGEIFFSPHFLYASEKISVSLTHPHHKALDKNKGALKLMGETAAEMMPRRKVQLARLFYAGERFLFIKELK